MPFIDCFQGCYKDKLRFFSGLFFLYRVAILLCFLLVQETHYMMLYTMSVILLILGIHSIVQPYKRRLHNVINSLILLDLTLINVCTIFASSTMASHESTYDYHIGNSLIFLGYLQLILIYSPILVAIAFGGRRVYVYMKSQRGADEEELYDSVDIDMHRQWEGIGYERLD